MPNRNAVLKNDELYQNDQSVRKYDTGWINRSDWINVHLGSDDTKDVDSNVEHNLNAELQDLIVNILVSSDGNDDGAFLVNNSMIHHFVAPATNTYWGITIYEIDENTIKVQTGVNGITYVADDGSMPGINTNDWYYKVVVIKKIY